MIKKGKKDETIRQFRQRVSNVNGRAKFAYRVEARNFSMRFLEGILALNETSVEELAVAAGVSLPELQSIVRRDPSRIPNRDTLFAIREASNKDVPQVLLEYLRQALQYVDASNRYTSLERAKKGHSRKVHREDFPPLPNGIPVTP